MFIKQTKINELWEW